MSRGGECIPACARPCPMLATLRYPRDILEGCFLKAWLWPWERHPSPPASGGGECRAPQGSAGVWALSLVRCGAPSCGQGQEEIGSGLWGNPLFARVISKERGSNDLLMLL